MQYQGTVMINLMFPIIYEILSVHHYLFKGMQPLCKVQQQQHIWIICQRIIFWM